jgi:hypothetical protein
MTKKRKPGPKKGRAALRAALAARRTRALPQEPRDGPTPEAMLKKLTLVGNADPSLAEHALGILRANGIIDEPEYRAGCIGRDLFAKAHGVKVNGSLDQRSGTAHMTQDQMDSYAKKYGNWNKARDRLMEAGDRAYHLVYRVAIGGELPAWALCNHCGTPFRKKSQIFRHELTEWESLRQGFRAWAEFFGVEREAAA